MDLVWLTLNPLFLGNEINFLKMECLFLGLNLSHHHLMIAKRPFHRW